MLLQALLVLRVLLAQSGRQDLTDLKVAPSKDLRVLLELTLVLPDPQDPQGRKAQMAPNSVFQVPPDLLANLAFQVRTANPAPLVAPSN